MSSKSSVVCGQLRKPQMMNSIQLLAVLGMAARLSERSEELKLGLFSASVGETERRTLFMEIKVVLGDTQNATAQNPMQLELTFWECHLFEQGLAQKAHEVFFSLSNPALPLVYCKEERLLTIHKLWVCRSFSMASWSNSVLIYDLPHVLAPVSWKNTGLLSVLWTEMSKLDCCYRADSLLLNLSCGLRFQRGWYLGIKLKHDLFS